MGTHSRDLKRIRHRDGPNCCWCGEPTSRRLPGEHNHTGLRDRAETISWIQPLSQDGSQHLSNGLLAHANCSGARGVQAWVPRHYPKSPAVVSEPDPRQTPKSILSLWQRDGGNCCWCNEPMHFTTQVERRMGHNRDTSKDASKEHLVAKVHDGGNEESNLLLAHQGCNNARGDAQWVPRWYPPPSTSAEDADLGIPQNPVFAQLLAGVKV